MGAAGTNLRPLKIRSNAATPEIGHEREYAMEKKTPFDLGYEAGYRAGVADELIIPAPPTIRDHEPEASVRFAEGAALGHAKGLERRTDVIRNAEAQMERADDLER